MRPGRILLFGAFWIRDFLEWRAHLTFWNIVLFWFRSCAVGGRGAGGKNARMRWGRILVWSGFELHPNQLFKKIRLGTFKRVRIAVWGGGEPHPLQTTMGTRTLWFTRFWKVRQLRIGTSSLWFTRFWKARKPQCARAHCGLRGGWATPPPNHNTDAHIVVSTKSFPRSSAESFCGNRNTDAHIVVSTSQLSTLVLRFPQKNFPHSYCDFPQKLSTLVLRLSTKTYCSYLLYLGAHSHCPPPRRRCRYLSLGT